MSQIKEVCAFRKRLQSYGYNDVSIVFQFVNNDDKFYFVKAKEPLSWQEVGRLISEKEMQNTFYHKKRQYKKCLK